MLQTERFWEEAITLKELLSSFSEKDFEKNTAFKEWNVADIIRHLYVWNMGAIYSATDKDLLENYLTKAVPAVMEQRIRDFERDFVGDIKSTDLFDKWWQSCETLKKTYTKIDPKTRLKWAGPDMSARSSITARLMETWAHSQAIYDMLKIKRTANPGLQDIADLGVRTFNWSFINRKLTAPDAQPYVKLKGCNEETWEWGEPNSPNKVSGDAMEFCNVVTQSRNIKDTNLHVQGEGAQQWMEIAQCFAGPAENPPEKGSRA